MLRLAHTCRSNATQILKQLAVSPMRLYVRFENTPPTPPIHSVCAVPAVGSTRQVCTPASKSTRSATRGADTATDGYDDTGRAGHDSYIAQRHRAGRCTSARHASTGHASTGDTSLDDDDNTADDGSADGGIDQLRCRAVSRNCPINTCA